MTRRRIVVSLLATALLAGCANAGSTLGGYSSQSAPRAVAPAGGPAVAPDQLSASGGSAGPASGQTAGIVVGTPPSTHIERSVNAAYTVAPGTFLTSFEGVIARGVGMGGYVLSSSTQPDGAGRIVSGSVTLKVPAAKIADFLNGMPSGFVASAINFSAVDHTAQFVDVDARLASARAHLAALDALLAKATSLGDITSLEQQIASVQTEVDTDQGQLNVLTASVDLATATVQMSERGTSVPPVLPNNPVSSGLGSGWDNAVHLTGAALEGVVTALPLLLVVGILLLVWRRLTRIGVLQRRPDTAE
ncbi:MAG: DUF4349 domain-containing protein [Candidatus Dormibacteraeota bacterium]|nr:DUF4349 domain-containing protein [Candidatus Dormibacteraeota bacterium]